MSSGVEVEVGEVMGGLEEGACWGNWSVVDKECSRCVIMARCSEATKNRQTGAAAVAPEPHESEPDFEEMPETDPLDYMLKTLEGRYDRVTIVKGNVRAEYFKKGGVDVVIVAISPDGKRMQVASAKGKRKYNTPSSIEEVEKILKEAV